MLAVVQTVSGTFTPPLLSYGIWWFWTVGRVALCIASKLRIMLCAQIEIWRVENIQTQQKRSITGRFAGVRNEKLSVVGMRMCEKMELLCTYIYEDVGWVREGILVICNSWGSVWRLICFVEMNERNHEGVVYNQARGGRKLLVFLMEEICLN